MLVAGNLSYQTTIRGIESLDRRLPVFDHDPKVCVVPSFEVQSKLAQPPFMLQMNKINLGVIYCYNTNIPFDLF